MDRTEFEEKLMTLGGDLDCWPLAEAEAAKQLLAADAESRALLEEVLTVDKAIQSITEAPLDAALMGRIMAATKKPAMDRIWVGHWRRSIPAGALAIVIVASIGFKTGYDGGFGLAEDVELAAAIAGDAFSLENMP